MIDFLSKRHPSDKSPREDQEARLNHYWSEFLVRFPTEESCLAELYRIADAAGLLMCPHCGDHHIASGQSTRVVTCQTCNKQVWLTAHTFFDHMRKSKPWLAAFWLMGNGISIGSPRLQKLVGTAQSSSLHILKKIRRVIHSLLERENAPTHDSALFSELFCKRSRETPARKHPIAEQDEVERASSAEEEEWQTDKFHKDGSAPGKSENHLARAASRETSQFALPASVSKQVLPPDSNSKQKTIGAAIDAGGNEATEKLELSERESEVYKHLSREPLDFDALCQRARIATNEVSSAITMMELAGVIRRLPGDRYVRCTSEKSAKADIKSIGIDKIGSGDDNGSDSEWLNHATGRTDRTVTAAINFVLINFHGISRKYLQNYLAAYWCHVERARWPFSTLVEACFQYGPVFYRHIVKYVSPTLVRMLTAD